MMASFNFIKFLILSKMAIRWSNQNNSVLIDIMPQIWSIEQYLY